MSLKPVSGKIESQELNDNFSFLQSLISNAESGVITGAFATLSELESKYPNGKSGIFVISELDDWYFWNGEEWQFGGTFRPNPLSDYMTTDGEKWEVI